MANSPSAMPGAFDLHPASRNTAPPRLSGAKSHIFQPPRTPNASASSSLILTRSTSSVMSWSSVGERPASLTQRKRMREEYHHGSGRATPRSGFGGEGEDWAEIREEGATPGSPRPFVNTRYVLAGGMDTPGAAQMEADMASQSQYADAGYRKSLGDSIPPDVSAGREPWGEHSGGGGGYFGREANGRGRFEHSQGDSDTPRGDGWSKAAFQVAGAVVGKAWEFCKSSAAVFRGFQAGGGTRYNVGANDGFEATTAGIWEEKNTWLADDQGGSTPLPGQFPGEELEFLPNYMDNPSAEPESATRPAKRRQISSNSQNAFNGREELARNWIMVPETAGTPSKLPVAPPRPLSRFSMPAASSASRRSVAIASSHRPASRAGFNTQHAARRSGLPSFHSRGSHAGPPALKAGGGASYASPRPSAGSPSKIPRATGSFSPLRSQNSPTPESPAAREAKRWAAMKQKESREADESIRRLDTQLKAMIREGKEALGTKVSVEMDDGDDLETQSMSRRNTKRVGRSAV